MGNTRNLNRIFTTILGLSFLVGILLYFHLSKNQPAQFPCDVSVSVPLFNPVYHPNGSVVEGDDVYPAGYYFSTNGTTRGCLCALKPCIRKCCSEDEQYYKVPKSPATCKKYLGPSPFGNMSALTVYTNTGETVNVDKDHFRILHGSDCRHGKFLLDSSEEICHILANGTILLQNTPGQKQYIDVSKYCLESINGEKELRAFVCFSDPDADEEETEIRFLIFPITMIVSVHFLLATIVVYCILPALRNLHGKCLVCQCLCLLITYIGLAIIQSMSSEIGYLFCVILAFLVQFSFLGSFFWLNVMSFDIWWSFSGLRPVDWGLKAKECKKFQLYSLYAWGMPLVIVAISVAMDTISNIPDSLIKPGMGHVRCWFVDDAGTFLYFYLPSGILLILNAVMFITTAFKLRSQARTPQDNVRFGLYLRLFILMGLSWIFELMSFFLGGPSSIWFVTDLINTLQGVAIFFFFVCRRDILQKLNKVLCPQWSLYGENSPESSKSGSITLTKTEDMF